MGHLVQRLEFSLEVTFEVQLIELADGAVVQRASTHDPFDDLGSEAIVGVSRQATERRQATLFQRDGPGIEITSVLSKVIGNL